MVSKIKKENSKPNVLPIKGVPIGANKRYQRLFEPSEVVDIRNIVNHDQVARVVEESKQVDESKIKDKKYIKTDYKIQDQKFIDNPDVPPLC